MKPRKMAEHTIPPEAVYWCSREPWQPRDPVLLLRTCRADGHAYNGFRWPLEVGALVEAPDWDPADRCGGGLHGLLWGEGDFRLVDDSDGAVALVIEACASETVEITRDGGGKAKCQRARVRYVGGLREAGAWLSARAPAGRRCHWGTATAGDRGTATAGYRGTATAGHWGTATAGYGGAAVAGDVGTAVAGDDGTATAGDVGTAVAGDGGTATAGDGGAISILYWNAARGRHRVLVGAVGEGDLLPGVPYRVDTSSGAARFVRADGGGT